MKKIFVIVTMVMVLAGLSNALVFDTIDNLETIRVTMINQEPDPVAPGNVVDVRFRIENLKTEPIRNVEVKIEPRYPFSLYGEEMIKSVGTLSAGQSGEAGVSVKYRIIVDSAAATGENELDFYYRINSGAWTKVTFNVEVRPRDAVLAINEIKTGNGKMLPGNMAKVSFVLENMAESTLKDIKLKLDLYSTTGTQTTELPFTPIGSGNEKTLKTIRSAELKNVEFTIFIDAEATSKVYKVPYTLTYSDEAGANFSRSGYLGLMVDAEPDLSINIDQTTIYNAGARGIVTVKIVNKGFSDIKFLDTVLAKTDSYDILSNPEVYIGNIDSDDYETAEYSLLVNNNAESPLKLPLKVQYRNANGELYTKDVNLEIGLFSGDALKERSGAQGNPWLGIIIVLVILVAGFFFYRRIRKRRKLNK